MNVSLSFRNIGKSVTSPGLYQSHLSGLEAVARFYGGRVLDGRVGSLKVGLESGKRTAFESPLLLEKPKGFNSPDSTLIVRMLKVGFQSFLPILIFADHEMELCIRSRTDEKGSPSADYLQHILVPFLTKHLGIQCAFELRKGGDFKGNYGEMVLSVSPLEEDLKCFSLLKRGEVVSITGIIWNAHETSSEVSCSLWPYSS